MSAVCGGLLSTSLANYREKHPDVSFQLVRAQTVQQFKDIIDGTIDIGFVILARLGCAMACVVGLLSGLKFFENVLGSPGAWRAGKGKNYGAGEQPAQQDTHMHREPPAE
jgi:DNA-binding transcriptional LysR family regulator